MSSESHKPNLECSDCTPQLTPEEQARDLAKAFMTTPPLMVVPTLRTLAAIFMDTFGMKEPKLLDVSSEGFYYKTLARVDKGYKSYTVLGDIMFLQNREISKQIKSFPHNVNVMTFSWKGEPYAIIEVPQGMSVHSFLFYVPGSRVVELIRYVRRLTRSFPTIFVYDTWNEIPLKTIEKMPFVVPSKVMAVWNQYIHPQLAMKQTYNHVIFSGPPGCGKTAFTRWVATKYPKWKFVFVPPSAITKPGHISQAFKFAQGRSPSVIVFEDIDLFGQNRNQESKDFTPLLGEMLNNLDGVEPRQKLLAIASTNNLPALDPAVIRPGRLGIHMTMEYTESEKLDIVTRYYKPKELDMDTILSHIRRVDSPVRLKMIAKLSEIYEVFEKHRITGDKFRQIVKAITEDKVPIVIPTNGEEDKDKDATTSAKSPTKLTESPA